MPDATPTLIVGATGAMGRSLARHLADRQHPLVLVARREGALSDLRSELGSEVTIAPLTGTGPSAIEAALDDSGVDDLAGVACCAGSLLLKPAHRTSDDELAATLAANVDTAFGCVRLAGGRIRKGGGVVLVSTAAVRLGFANHEAIAAAKGAIEGLTRSAAATYAKRGIRVNAVAPGLVDTPLARPITGDQRLKEASERMHALGRIGQPEDVVAAMAFLLSDQAPWITGQVLGVDGGLGSLRTP